METSESTVLFFNRVQTCSRRVSAKLFWETEKLKKKKKPHNKIEFILSIFAFLPWMRKAGTQTMTRVEAYHITKRLLYK